MKYFKHSLRSFNILLIAGLCLASSCKKLDEKPISFVDPDSFFTNPDQVEAALAASMDRIWSYWGGYGYAQNVFFNDDQYNDGDLVIGNNHGDFLWNQHYLSLKNLNLAIGAMKKGTLGTTATPAQLDLLMAQAKFIRAHNYFQLVRMFGDVPLITEDTPDEALAGITRSPIADVYTLIISDFTEAAANLPSTWPTEKRGRPASGAAKGLLAKVYLTMATAPLNEVSNYQKAANLANEVIQAGVYSLEPDITKVFSLETKYGPEMMWSYISNYADGNTHAQIYRGWSQQGPFFGGWGDIGIQPQWEQQYPASPRKDAYLLTLDDNGVNYKDWVQDPRPFIRKFMYDKQEDYDNYFSVMNMPVIRFADVLLIFAEAENMAKSGPTQAAVDAVNMVIDRANGYVNNPLHPKLTIGMSKEAFDAAVIEERNQEFCFEFDRWFDLVRKRILKEQSIPEIQQNFTENDYLFPIPDNEILLNPNLTQNPGY